MPPKDLSTNHKNDAPKMKDEMNGIGTSTPSSKAAKFLSCSIDEQPSPICAPRTQSVRPTNADAKNLFLKKRQRKPTNHVNHKDPICVETYNMPDKSSKEWIPALGLSSSDRNRLASWLTDSIIDAAQKLLKEISPLPGLQSVACGLTMTFVVQPGEFVQILHTREGHCVTVSTIGTTHSLVCVFDSLYSSAGTRLEAQIAGQIHTEKPEICFEFMDVPVQAGTYDCGLFAVAFTTALALRKRPEDYHFDQSRMRKHLWQCFEERKMEMFPCIRQRRSKKTMVRLTQKVPVYCMHM